MLTHGEIDSNQAGQYQDHAGTPTKKKPQMLFLGENGSSRAAETFECWICQEILSSETFLLQHYDDHMMDTE